jgi:hypothetical protein
MQQFQQLHPMQMQRTNLSNNNLMANKFITPTGMLTNSIPIPASVSVLSNSVSVPRKRSSRQYPCTHPGCNETLRTRFSLKRHYKKHSGEKPVKKNIKYKKNCIISNILFWYLFFFINLLVCFFLFFFF